MSIHVVGVHNPHPSEALDPSVAGSAGSRLFLMSGLSHGEYLSLKRSNLDEIQGLAFRRGDVVIALGDEVREAFGLPRLLIHPLEREGVTYRQIPHPSGRTRFYNDPVCRDLVKELFRCLTAERPTATTSLAAPSPRASSSSSERRQTGTR